MDKKRIGFWGGCFNPPSCAHLELANDMLKHLNLDKIVFVPVGDYYEKVELEEAKHRYNMLKILTNNKCKLEVEDIEIKSSKMLYAKDAFELIQKKYVNEDIYFIMGSDNFLKMNTWKEYDDIIEKYKYIIVERPNFKVNIDKENIILYKPKSIQNTSSTVIRDRLKNKENLKNFLDEEVYKYIMKNKLYNA